MKRVKHLPETEDFSITSAVKDTKKEKISDNELPDSIRGLISLDSNTVRYLNKRKPSDKTNSAYTLHASRANVVMLQPIFEGLPSYSDGTITLHDLNEAIHHLSKPQKERVAIFNDARVTSAFFRDLDLCRSGKINFREFALGMANYPGHSNLTLIEIMRLKDAFQEYSSSKRREQIIKESSDTSFSDSRRFSELKKLLYLTSARIADLSNRDDDCGTRENKMLASMFIESPRSKINRRKASLRAKAARIFLNGEKNDRKNSINLSNSFSRELKFDTFLENKPISSTENIQNNSIFDKSSRLNLIYDIDKIEIEEREKEKIQRDEKVENIEKEIKRIKKELHKKIKNSEKEKELGRQKDNGIENENENENESLNLKNENDFFNHLECQEEINKNKNKNKSKFKHLSMNRLSSMSKRRSDPFLFPNIKLLNQPIVTP